MITCTDHSCSGFLTDGTRCPGTLAYECDATLDQSSGSIPARRFSRPGCPRSLTTFYRIPQPDPAPNRSNGAIAC